MVLPGLELVGQSVRTQLDVRDVDLGYFHPGALFTLIQPDHYGLLSGRYTGPADQTQHYFYAGIALLPLAALGLRNGRVARMALFLGVPFVWYAAGPAAGLFDLVVRLPGFSGVELPMHGWFLPARGPACATILFLHGNAENISTHIGSVFWLPARGFNVFMPDYRGYGASEGAPSLAGCTRLVE